MIHALVVVPLADQGLASWFPGVGVEAWWRGGNAVLLAVAALVLVRPDALWRSGLQWGAVLLTLVVPLLALLAVLGVEVGAAPGPRIGVTPVDVPDPAEPGRRVVEVDSVVTGAPAAGRLQAGDRILAINGVPLDAARPAEDLVARAQSAALPPGPTIFTIDRLGQRREVVLDLPPLATGSRLAGAFRATFLRNSALLVILALFLWRDAQGLDAVGLERESFWEATRFGLPALGLLMFSHFLLSVLIAAVALGVGAEVVEAEVGQRRIVMDTLLAERLAWTAGIVVVGSITEEVVFRGFLLPRLRHALGSWVLAAAVSVVAFGLGHLYEGVLATVQTAGIAAVLSVVFLLRRHLMPCIVAHVGFNTLALFLAYLFLQLGLFERLGEILGS